MITPHRIASALLLIGLTASSVSAETFGSSSTSSVSSVSPESPVSSSSESPELLRDRERRAENLRSAFLKAKASDEKFTEQKTVFHKKRAELRLRCRDDLRKANRDAKLPALLRCYQSDQTLLRGFLSDERTYWSTEPGLTKTVRGRLIDRLDLATDALDTIISALESDVFETTEDVMESKTKFFDRYLTPLAEARRLAHTDRAISIASALILSLDATAKSEQTTTASGSLRWQPSRTCLTKNEGTLRELLSEAVTGSGDVLRLSIQNVSKCLPMIKEIPKVGSGATQP